MANTRRGTGLARMETERAALDAGFHMVFVLGRSAAIEIQVVPHAVGFDRVPGVRHGHVPVLDDGLIEAKFSHQSVSETRG